MIRWDADNRFVAGIGDANHEALGCLLAFGISRVRKTSIGA